METTRLSDEEIIELIEYGIIENQVDFTNISGSSIKSILYDYKGYCYEEEQKKNGELDTFTRAACLLVAINAENLTTDNIVNASIAISSATKMCENAYIEDTQYNTLIALKEIDIKEAYEQDPDLYNYWTKNLFEGLFFGDDSIEKYSKDLKTFHEVTTRICKNRKETKQKNK